MRKEGAERRSELEPRDDPVHHAVCEQELGALEPFGERRPKRALDHARPGEADERSGLDEVHVPEKRRARRDTAGRRMQQHADERLSYFSVAPQRGHGFRHLHEAQDSFLHAGTPRRMQQHDWEPFRGGALEEPSEPLPHDGTHAAPHEAEDETAVGDTAALDSGRAYLDALARLCGAPRALDALLVGLSVLELERIRRLDVLVPELELGFVEQERPPLARRHLVVMAARGAYVPARLELFGSGECAATGALSKETLADGALLGAGGLCWGPLGERHGERRG